MSLSLTLTKQHVMLAEWEYVTHNPPTDRSLVDALMAHISVTAPGLGHITNFGISEDGYAFEVYFTVNGLPLELPGLSHKQNALKALWNVRWIPFFEVPVRSDYDDDDEFEVVEIIYQFLVDFPLETRDLSLKVGRIGLMDHRGICVTFYIDTVDDFIQIINDLGFYDRFCAIAAVLEVRLNGAMMGLSLKKK